MCLETTSAKGLYNDSMLSNVTYCIIVISDSVIKKLGKIHSKLFAAFISLTCVEIKILFRFVFLTTLN